MNSSAPENQSELDQLIAVMRRLRSPDGCPWDFEQTHESLVRYLIEETFELVEAIESGSREELIEELGDVLYQVLFHADIASNYGVGDPEPFDIQEVARASREKMIGRHPHVFDTPDASVSTAQLIADWEQIKQAEKPERASTLDGVPMAMPALLLTDKLLGKVEKLADQQGEIPVNRAPDEQFQTEAELGDRLLGIIAEARSRGLDAERALRARIRTLTEDIREVEAGQPSTLAPAAEGK